MFISGLINLETTLQIDSFPIHYDPVRYPFFGVHSTVSGVGYNLAKALARLGERVKFASIIGKDESGDLALHALEAAGVSTAFIRRDLEQTAQSVILYDHTGRRAINVDLKDIQESSFPMEQFEGAVRDCQAAALCNINFSRPFLKKARQMGKLVATDVHAISDINDDYNRDFMSAAHILFMSDERLPCSPREWVRQVQDRYQNDIIVIGMGAQGALLAVRQDNYIEKIPAITTRKVVNTIGAGDALFSCFLHYYVKTRDPYLAIRKASYFASYKIGETGAAEGFLSEKELESVISHQ